MPLEPVPIYVLTPSEKGASRTSGIGDHSNLLTRRNLEILRAVRCNAQHGCCGSWICPNADRTNRVRNEANDRCSCAKRTRLPRCPANCYRLLCLWRHTDSLRNVSIHVRQDASEFAYIKSSHSFLSQHPGAAVVNRVLRLADSSCGNWPCLCVTNHHQRVPCRT